MLYVKGGCSHLAQLCTISVKIFYYLFLPYVFNKLYPYLVLQTKTKNLYNRILV